MWYGRYQLSDGAWQAWGAWESKKEAKDALEFHAQGRPVQVLSWKEFHVFQERDGGRSLADLAKEMRTSKETIRQIEARVRRKILTSKKWSDI
jgi:DNA-directed RNA polymerase sigma subunit (sigma70/sigma32)